MMEKLTCRACGVEVAFTEVEGGGRPRGALLGACSHIRSWDEKGDGEFVLNYYEEAAPRPESVSCPGCSSKRIIYVRHDSDWGNGHGVDAVNGAEAYEEFDLDKNGNVEGFGDINMYVCLGCDYVWQVYGSFVFPKGAK